MLVHFAGREPYERVTELIDVPIAFLEIVTLAEKAEKDDASSARKIKEIMSSVIEVVLSDSESLLKLENLAQSGYKIAFLPTEKLDPVSAR
jgi:hypothetical protein